MLDRGGILSLSCTIESSFRNLVLEIPYEKITISLICQAANVSRTAFYSCFTNKEDLIEKLLDKDIVQPLRTLREILPTAKIKSAPQLLAEQLYLGFEKRKDYYTKISKINRGRYIFTFLTNRLEAINTEIFKNVDLPAYEKQYAAFFFAASNVTLITRWIENGMDIEASTMASLYVKMTQHYWNTTPVNKVKWD